jgi:glycerophosphoryl diester phosphodiesterase
VDRTTSGRGRVGDLSLAEIRALSAGYPERFGRAYGGERVPTLAEVLGLLRGRARLMVEIKTESVTDAEADGIEARTITEVRKADMTREVAFLSFDRRALLRCRRQAPEIPRGHLFVRGRGEEMVAGAREAACDIVMPEKSALSDEVRKAVQAAGLKLASWVVDEPEELAALARFQLYGVGSNRPGLLLEALADGI